MTHPQVVLIAAVARNGAVGKGNALLWKESADQQHFRRVTMGCPVVMGRKTWDSLPVRFRPLPGRRNVVLSRDDRFSVPGAEIASSLDGALARLADAPKVFVIGGAEVYAQALPLADAMVLTEIDAEFEADAFFPAWDRQAFDEVQREPQRAADGTGFAFVTYRRRPR